MIRNAMIRNHRTQTMGAAFGTAIARDAPPSVQTLVSALLRTRLEVAFAGLDGAGKSTLASALRAPNELTQIVPTIGLVVNKMRHRGVDLMVWDLGGQQRFRDDWFNHVRGCGALIFVVDVTDSARLAEARQALFQLLEDPVVGSLPLLVLANKADLLAPIDRASEEIRGWPMLVQELSLDTLEDVNWCILGVSATRQSNLDKILRWLILQAHGAGGTRKGEEGEIGSTGASGRLSQLWGYVGSWRRRNKWAFGGRAGGYASVLAASLLGEES